MLRRAGRKTCVAVGDAGEAAAAEIGPARGAVVRHLQLVAAVARHAGQRGGGPSPGGRRGIGSPRGGSCDGSIWLTACSPVPAGRMR